ncbi:MAG: deoxyribodipyrimidine photo-lyase [Bacteroidales bacterium]
MTRTITLFWFRRDLRLSDNVGLFHALSSKKNVLPLFIFDTNILSKLPQPKDRRVDVLHQIIQLMHHKLKEYNSSIIVKHGTPEDVFAKLFKEYNVESVYTNKDYEPYAKERDTLVEQLCKENNIDFKSYTDHVIFESDSIRTQNDTPYTVYSPYARTWMKEFEKINIQSFNIEKLQHNFKHIDTLPYPTLSELGFTTSDINYTPYTLPKKIINTYHKNRDFPSIEGTSTIGFHLRFGTISIREAVQYAYKHSLVWLGELIWREFYMSILDSFPKVTHSCFKEKYNFLNWRNNEKEFELWCKGETGYPIVDAGMRQLNKTGWMHNRVRMITASFLCKHLCIDWRWGEAYFAEKLLDYELASNNGNWQWAASTGCDAVPYFRIFNPVIQQKKFDTEFIYISTWVPEYNTPYYPAPVVEHTFARERALQMYKEVNKP